MKAVLVITIRVDVSVYDVTHKKVKVMYFVRFCSSASNRIIGAKDHASIQMNIAEVKLIVSVGKLIILCMNMCKCPQ